MAVSTTDIVQYLSASSGSTGGAITGSSIASGVPNNVWPDITDVQRLAGIILHRKTFWKNNNAVDSLLVPVIFNLVAPVNAALMLGLGVDSSDDTDAAQGNMTAFSAPALAFLASDTPGDTRTVTIYGMDNSGSPVPVSETLTLNGTTPVASGNTFSKVWGWWVSAPDAGKVVTLKQGSGGTTRGTIGNSKKASWLWVTAGSKGAGIHLPDLSPLQNYGLWRRLTVTAGAGPVRPDTLTVRIEENA
jgi:hypothetical protein